MTHRGDESGDYRPPTFEFCTRGHRDPFSIRVVELDGNPWFVAKDVCDVLGLLPHPRGGYSHHFKTLGADERLSLQKTHMPDMGSLFSGTISRVLTISESGLYKLIMRSDKPQAKHFQDWVTRVVLPTIRKEGAYVAGEEHIGKGTEEDDEAIILRAMKIMERKIEKLKEERERARQERDEAIETKDALKESVGTYMHTVRDYVKNQPWATVAYRNGLPLGYQGSRAHPATI